MLKIGIPWGSPFKKVLKLFSDAGLPIIRNSDCKRDFRIRINDSRIEIIEISRAQQIPSEVEKGIFDLGFTSQEWIMESVAHISEEECLAKFSFSKNGDQAPAIALLASAKNKSILDLNDRKQEEKIRIGTELKSVAWKFMRTKGIQNFRIIPSFGATEAMIPRRADYIVELVDSGESVCANDLVVVEKIMDVPPMLIACWESMRVPEMRKLIFEIRDQLVAADKK